MQFIFNSFLRNL
ncbi:hypothetical protein CP082626L3_0675A, partial [Chlamydia psittaci 08-2626_L3]